MIQKKRIIFSFSSLLLFSLTNIAYAQQISINCSDSYIDRGSACKNSGTIINNNHGGTINIIPTPLSQPELPYNSSVSSQNTTKQPRNPFVRVERPTLQPSLISDEK
jgi:hypothetical protein